MADREAHGADVEAPRAILVLGMHRSGTSALAGALGACGVELGDRLIDAAPDNPQGYFENIDAVLANERLLDALDRAWDDVRVMPDGWLRSQPAAEAATAIRDGVLPAFAHARTWAIKDPRMCRVLPLWTCELQRAGIDAAGLVVMRHPDEVAASLSKRDGMHPRAAHLLWLRHVLEAARHAPSSSACLRYADLLADPDGVLGAAADALGLDIRIDRMRLRALLSEESRHHRHASARVGDPWHALSLDAYEALAGAAWRDVLPALEARLARLDAESDGWIDAVGMAAREADRRRRRATAEAIGAQARAELLQEALDRANALAETHVRDLAALDRAMRETSDGLRQAEGLAHSRAAESERLAHELRRTQEALAHAEAVSDARVAEAEQLMARIAAMEEALATAERLVAERAAELEATVASLARTDEALAQAQRLVEARTAEAARAAAEVARTADALARAEDLARARLGEITALHSQQARVHDALAHAEALVASTVAHAAELEAVLSRTQEGLERAETLATERGQEVAMLAAELGRTQAGLAQAEALAIGRLSELEHCAAQRDAEHAARIDAEAAITGLRGRVTDLEAALDAAARERGALHDALARIVQSRLWPVFARLARLPPRPFDG